MVRQNFDLKLVSEISVPFLSQLLFGKRARARGGGNRASSFGLKSIAPWCVPHQLQIALKN